MAASTVSLFPSLATDATSEWSTSTYWAAATTPTTSRCTPPSAQRPITFVGAGSNKIGFKSVSYGVTLANRGNFIGKTGYIGFGFPDPTKASQTDFGWAEFSESGNQATLTLINAAFDNTGAAIRVGDVPESTSVGLLAAGACGLGLWRRQAAQRRIARGRGSAAGVAATVA